MVVVGAVVTCSVVVASVVVSFGAAAGERAPTAKPKAASTRPTEAQSKTRATKERYPGRP
jgi:hypothetical protein